jgi:hypothetical protein
LQDRGVLFSILNRHSSRRLLMHLNTDQLRRVVLLVCLVLLATEAVVAQQSDPRLVELRRQLALSYAEPAPHMALAKYFWSKGDRLQAFYLLEYARRAMFPEPQFNEAFAKAFGGRGGDGESKQAVALFNKAIELQRAGETKQAEELFLKAAELAPRSVNVQSWVGRYFFKERHDDLRALPFYLTAYFLDPHAYEAEFVESRIRTINYDEATLRYRLLGRNDASLEEILKEPNPTVIVLALENLSDQWQPAYIKTLLGAMTHDDEEVRWLAAEAIRLHADRSFDETLKALLRDDDLRIRGLAAYISVHLWKQQSFEILRAMLRDQAQLLRFDAISALSREGGSEGRRILLARRRFETQPRLRRMIDDALRPQAQAQHASVTTINLAAIGRVAPKGRVQDRDYNDLPVVSRLLQRGKESIPFLISKLDDETRIEDHVFDYWSEVRVGDVALVILTDFFLDSSWQKTTIPGVGWNDFLESGSDRSLTSEQVLRNYISKHGRKAIKERWQKIWVEYRDRLSWDERERCFKVN